MIKISTDFEQSKKLADILPTESADMSWTQIYDENHMMSDYRLDLLPYRFNSGISIPSWSLSALFALLDDTIDGKNGETYRLHIYKELSEYQLAYYEQFGECDDIDTGWHEELIDACYDLILKLKDEKLI